MVNALLTVFLITVQLYLPTPCDNLAATPLQQYTSRVFSARKKPRSPEALLLSAPSTLQGCKAARVQTNAPSHFLVVTVTFVG